MNKKLYRSRDNKMISGVLGGLAEYTGVDATILRIIAVAALVFGFGAVGLVYLACIFIVPEEREF